MVVARGESITVPDFTISVSGSSCKFLVSFSPFFFILSIFWSSYPALGMSLNTVEGEGKEGSNYVDQKENFFFLAIKNAIIQLLYDALVFSIEPTVRSNNNNNLIIIYIFLSSLPIIVT